MGVVANLVVRVTASISDFEKEIAGLERKWGRMGAKLESIGGNLTRTVTLPLVAAGGAALKLSADFETAMTKVRTIAGESAGNIGMLKQGIMDLAPTVGIGPTALAEALLVVESTGLKGSAALDVLKLSAQASAVGLGEATDVARAITAAVNAYGSENLTAARAADILFQTVVEGGAEADQLAGELGRVVGVASQLGVSFEEVGAFIATYTRLGLSAAEATTGLSGVLNTILSPSSEGAKALQSLGLSADALRASVKEKGLQAALSDLVGSLNGNAEATAAVFGNVRALAGVLGTSTTQAESYRQVLERLKNSTGSLADAFDVWKGTQAATWGEFTARVQIAAIALGDKLAPAFSQMLNAAMPVLDAVVKLSQLFGSLPEPVQTTAFALGGIAVAAGPVIWAIGNLMTLGSSLIGAFKLLGPAVSSVVGVFSSFGPAIAVVATAIASFKLGSFIAELKLGSMAIGDWIEFLAAWKFGLAGVTAENVKLAISARRLGEVGLPALPASPNMATGGALPTMPIGIDEAFARLGTAAQTATPKVKGLTDEHVRLRNEMLATAAEAERELTSFEFFQRRGAMPLQQALAGLGVQWNDLTDAIIPTQNGLTGMEPVMANLGRYTLELGSSALPTLNVGLAETSQRFITAAKSGQGFGDFLKNDLGKIIVGAFQGGGDVGKSIGGAIGGFLTGPNGIIGKAIGKIGGSLGSVLGSIVPGLGTLLGGLAGSGLGKIFGKLFGNPEKQINPIRQAFVDAAGGLDALNQKAAAAGVTLKAMLDAKTPEQYKAAIDELNAAFEFQDQAMQTLQETAARYGFVIEELGPAMQRQQLSEQAQQLFQDFSVLTAAGISTDAILARMGDSVNQFVQTALRTGTEIPAAMRPMLEQFAAAGQLVDAQGNKITNLEDSGITFSETMTEGFNRVVESVNKLSEAIARGLGLPLSDVTNRANAAADAMNRIRVPSTPGLTYWNPDEPILAPPPEGASTGARITRRGVQQFANGGFVMGRPFGRDTVPAMLAPGELVLNAAQQENTAAAISGGTQMVELLADIRGLLASGKTVSVQVDGREIVKAEQKVFEGGGSILTYHKELLGVA